MQRPEELGWLGREPPEVHVHVHICQMAVQVSVAVRGVAASSLVECELRARLPNRALLARQGPPSIYVLMAVA